ncbi:sigma-70 family RNA polymerase sigma factor [Sinomonas sp. P47F7]|uniref:sigma-70 family RNA polymerase sigma factor n=1 Tax=Sinomonas sp. P47F7 TaxID=3410987 RepID=UPI003BF566E5
MDVEDLLASRFESERGRLRAVAYRMLGSLPEADDAVQEAWLRLARTDADAIESLGAWLTTVVARICLNVLRARALRREEPIDGLEEALQAGSGEEPEEEAVMADAVGLALLVVLDALQPAERLAFVLHDMFDVPFDRIAPILGKSSEATRQLASRARRRVRGSETPDPDRARQRRAVEAYLAAVRSGDFDALVELLAPDVVINADAASSPSRLAVTLRGAEQVAHAAVASAVRAPFARVALVNGRVALVVAPKGHLRLVLAFTVDGDRVTHIEVVAEPSRLRALEVAVVDG